MSYGITNQAGQVRQATAIAMLKLAAEKGIDTLDTAIAYGESETRLGEVGARGFNLVTKLPAAPSSCDNVTDWINDQVSASLGRLGVDSVYGLLLHRSEQLLGPNSQLIFRALQNLKEAGLVRKIGISIYDPAELDALCSSFQFDIVQAPFNILDRRLIDTGWLSRLPEQGIELHVRSVFLQGLLLTSPTDRPNKFSRWGQLWSDWDKWLTLNRITPLQACIHYALSFPQITKVIVGAVNRRQLEEILEASARTAPKIPDELRSDDLDLINPANWALLS